MRNEKANKWPNSALDALKPRIITQSGSMGGRRSYSGIEWLKKIKTIQDNEENTGAMQLCGEHVHLQWTESID